jgi:hypothetical protein
MTSHSNRSSLGPFTAKSRPATAGVEKLYPFTVSNLSLSSSGSLPWCSKAHLPTSAPFRARPPGRHPAGYPAAVRLEQRHSHPGFPLPFGRRHWEAARKVDITGQAVVVDPAGPLAEAAWAKQRLGRATQALPNGFCGLLVQKTCPHANACLTCPMFVTTAEFLSQHRTHRAQVIELITTAQARGQARLVEMNQQVLGNFDRIITTLDDDAATDQAVSNAG